MRTLLSLLVCLAAATNAYATRQIRDRIVVGGREYTVEEGPSIHGFFPNDDGPEFRMWTTANYKGYCAVWEVRNDALYLKSVEGKTDAGKVTTKDVFPGREAPVPARWYSGAIIAPAGREIGTHQRETRHVSDLELYMVFSRGKLLRMEVRRQDPEYVPVYYDNRTLPLPGSAEPARSFTWNGKTYRAGAFPEPAVYVWEEKVEAEPEGAAEFLDGTSVSFLFDGEPLTEAVKKLTEWCEVPFETELKKTRPTLTLRVKDMPLRLALDRISALTGTMWHVRGRNIVFREDQAPFGAWTVTDGLLYMGKPHKVTATVALPEGREIGLHVAEGRIAYAKETRLTFREGVLEKAETVTYGPEAVKSRTIAPFRNEVFREKDFMHSPASMVFPWKVAGLTRTVLNESTGGEDRIMYDGTVRRVASEKEDIGGGILVVYRGEGLQAVMDVYRAFPKEATDEEKAVVREKVLKGVADHLTHHDLYTETKMLSKEKGSADPLTAVMALARGKRKFRCAIYITIEGRDLITIRFTGPEEGWEKSAKVIAQLMKEFGR